MIAFASVGDNCIDRFLPPDEHFMVGGNAVNVAAQLAMLGEEAYYFGAVGQDDAGEAVRSALLRQSVRLSGFRVISGAATALTEIETAPSGERHFVFEDFGASALYIPDEQAITQLRGMAHVHIGWMRGVARLKTALTGSGAILSQDLSVNNDPEELQPGGLDIAFCSSQPAEADAVAQRLLTGGARLAVVTMGPAGSMATDGIVRAHAKAAPISVVDTTGAGDAFIAGFLNARAKGVALTGCLVAGATIAAAACQHRGGFPQLPLPSLVQHTFR